MSGPTIAPEVLARYAADAAREAPGVARLVASRVPTRPHRGVRVTHEGDAAPAVEVHVAVEWGSSIPDVAADVQQRVAGYLRTMAGVEPVSVDVVVDAIA